MLSLENAFTEAEARNFEERLKAFLADHRGIRLCRRAQDGRGGGGAGLPGGRLEVGSTRGDGYRGENVTQNLKTIHTIPLTLLSRDLTPPASRGAGGSLHRPGGFQKAER